MLKELEGKVLGAKERLIALREKTGLNRKDFAEKFGIPYQTITCWELGKREMPEYVLRLIAYRIEMDPLLKKGEQDP